MLRSRLHTCFSVILACLALASGPAHCAAVTPAFSSHLPLLVFEPGDGDTVRVTIHDAPDGSNSPDSANAVAIDVRMLARPGSTREGKATHAMELAAGDPLSLAGLPPGREWLLQGSTRDKNMLRNGIGYELGRLLFPGVAPESRYCEVLVRLEDGQYEYHGLYILTETEESIKRRLAAAGGDGYYFHHIQSRERRGGNILRAGSRIFAVTRLASDGSFTDTLTKDERLRLGVELEKLESILYSVYPATFLTYQKHLDEASAIDFFILNNLLINALDTAVPVTLYKNPRGRVAYMPEWSFDTALDNQPERNRPLPFEAGVVDIAPPSVLARKLPVWRVLESGGTIRDLRMYPVFDALGGENFLWFDRLFLSSSFINGLYERYHQLRRTHLSPGRLLAMVDRLALHLGPALERDWARWHDAYTAETGRYALEPYIDEEGELRDRQTRTVEEELVKIRYCLREQDIFTLGQLEELNWMTHDLYNRSTSGTRQAGYAFLTLVGMFILTHLLTRRL